MLRFKQNKSTNPWQGLFVTQVFIYLDSKSEGSTANEYSDIREHWTGPYRAENGFTEHRADSTTVSLDHSAAALPHLTLRVEKLLDHGLDLVEENGVEQRRHLVSDQVLDVLLDGGAELLVRADQQV